MGRRHLALLLAACAFTSPAFATLVTIDANSYAVGTTVTNTFSGATLEFASVQLGLPVTFDNLSSIAVGAYPYTFPFSSLTLNTLGSNTFYLNQLLYGGPPNGYASAIYMTFAEPVYSVGATDFSPYGDPTVILNLNSEGSIIGTSYTSGTFCLPLGDGSTTCNDEYLGFVGEAQRETYSATKPITSILIGSADAASWITSIRFLTVPAPEPPSIVTFASGLLGVMLVILRRRRRCS